MNFTIPSLRLHDLPFANLNQEEYYYYTTSINRFVANIEGEIFNYKTTVKLDIVILGGIIAYSDYQG